MVRWILTKWVVLAVAVALTAALFPGIDVDGGVLTLLAIAAVFGVVDALLGPVVRLLALPLIILTLGLFSLLINAFLFLITDALLDRLDVDGIAPAVGGALVISVLVVILEAFAHVVLRRTARSRGSRARTAQRWT